MDEEAASPMTFHDLAPVESVVSRRQRKRRDMLQPHSLDKQRLIFIPGWPRFEIHSANAGRACDALGVAIYLGEVG